MFALVPQSRLRPVFN